MQFLFISFISILLASCSSKKDNSTIPESYAKVLRETNGEILQITDKSQLEASDFLMIGSEKNESVSKEDLKNIAQSSYDIVAFSECQIGEKSATTTTHLKTQIIDLKSILPLEFFLTSQPESQCNFNITLLQNGSSKTFNFIGTTIRNKNVNPVQFLGNEKGISINGYPKVIEEKDFNSYTVVETKKEDALTLICENFYTKTLFINDQIVPLQNLVRLTDAESINTQVSMDPRLYIPYQNCVLHVRKKSGQVELSPIFQLRYTPLAPDIQFIDHRYVKRDPPDFWDAFYIDISNPQTQSITVAIDKSKLHLAVQIILERCHHLCQDYVKDNLNVALAPSYSNPEFTKEVENAILIHLEPNQKIRVTFQIHVGDNYHSEHWTKWDLSTKKDLIQNLKANYQNWNEVPNTVEMIGSAL